MPNQHTKNPIPAGVRFWAKVDKNGPIPDYAPHLGPCWLWTAGTTPGGYAQFRVGGKHLRAHRWLYEQEHGSIPHPLECDHLCRVRHCVRPSHIEPVTCRMNIMRGEGVAAKHAKVTHCPRGHPYDQTNTYLPGRGGRECRHCRRLAQAKYLAGRANVS